MHKLGVAGLVAILGLSACATPKGSTVEDRRMYVHAMESETLERFYRADPSMQDRIQSAIGYGVFNNLSMRLLAVGTGHGYGIARNQLTGEPTYMRMGQLGAGVGLGVSDFSAVFIFHDAGTYHRFVESGWQFGASAEASAIASGDKGLSLGTQANVTSREAAVGGGGIAGVGASPPSRAGSTAGLVEVYRLTKSGLALRADVSGTKYWKDSSLNAREAVGSGSGRPVRAFAPGDAGASR